MLKEDRTEEQVRNNIGSVVYLLIGKKCVIHKNILLKSLLAGIPSPIYFGALIDTTCLKWGTMTCGGEGACRMYDIVTYRYIFYFILISPPWFIIKCLQIPLYALHLFLVGKLFRSCVRNLTQHFFLALALFAMCDLYHRCCNVL